MSTDELVDIVDDDDTVLYQATRAEVRRANLLHRNVAILCLNRAGQICLHRRSVTKDLFPGLYDMFTSGVVGAGETYVDAAIRELEEELGIHGVALEPLFHHRYEGDRTRAHTAVYRVEWNGAIRPQATEIEWVGHRTRQELVANLEGFEIVPDGAELFTRYIAACPQD
jgi:isopentenyldiphosphate isomerase